MFSTESLRPATTHGIPAKWNWLFLVPGVLIALGISCPAFADSTIPVGK